MFLARPNVVRSLVRFSRARIVVLQRSSLSTISPDDRAREFRKENQIIMKGTEIDKKKYYPYYNYTIEDVGDNVAEEDKEAGVTPFFQVLKKCMIKQGYKQPTAIQAQSWPVVLDGRDVISVARTGSGKTVGFLLPGLQKIMLENRDSGAVEDSSPQMGERRKRGKPVSPPRMLIVAPTRELVTQIEDEAYKYCSTAGLKSVCVYGGASKNTQINLIRSGADIVVATPGRCNDLVEMGALDLSQVKYLVLDEADRMLDMGFEPQIREIIKELPAAPERQTLFFTATWPRDVQGLAMEFLHNPMQINIGDTDTLNANKKIVQNIFICKEHEKEDKLFNLMEDKINTLEKNPSKDPFRVPKTLVFVSRKANCDYIADQMKYEGFKVASLHGDMAQGSRSRVLDLFRSGRIRILIATDVAGRGLDVKDIENVINYDFPEGGTGVEDYVHRIGRTARGDMDGVSYTFMTPVNAKDDKRVEELCGVLERCEQKIPPELMDQYEQVKMRKSRGGSRGGGGQERSRFSQPGQSRSSGGKYGNMKKLGDGDDYGGGRGGFGGGGGGRGGDRGGGSRGGGGGGRGGRDGGGGGGFQRGGGGFQRGGGGGGGDRGGGGKRNWDDDDEFDYRRNSGGSRRSY